MGDTSCECTCKCTTLILLIIAFICGVLACALPFWNCHSSIGYYSSYEHGGDYNDDYYYGDYYYDENDYNFNIDDRKYYDYYSNDGFADGENVKGFIYNKKLNSWSDGASRAKFHPDRRIYFRKHKPKTYHSNTYHYGTCSGWVFLLILVCVAIATVLYGICLILELLKSCNVGNAGQMDLAKLIMIIIAVILLAIACLAYMITTGYFCYTLAVVSLMACVFAFV